MELLKKLRDGDFASVCSALSRPLPYQYRVRAVERRLRLGLLFYVLVETNLARLLALVAVFTVSWNTGLISK